MALRVISSRRSRILISIFDYQPLIEYTGDTLVLLAVSASSPEDTKTDQTLGSVGCTTRLAATLSAHFRWGLRVRAFC
jgi:hypothetical protein